MRCTDCKLSKETIPAQLNYIYCTKFKKEMSVVTEFENCQYKESNEYKLKKAIQDYCNNEANWIVAIDKNDLLCNLFCEFKIPTFIQDIKAARAFETKVCEALKESEVTLKTASLTTIIDDSGEERDEILILQKPFA